MKKLLTVIAAAIFVIYPSVCFASYVIHLKDGREFVTDRYWEEGNQIKFKRYGGVIGIQKGLVKGIEERGFAGRTGGDGQANSISYGRKKLP